MYATSAISMEESDRYSRASSCRVWLSKSWNARLTIDPLPCVSIWAISYFMQKYTPRTLVSSIARYLSLLDCTNVPVSLEIPALLTAMSSRPNSAMMLSIIDLTACSSVTSLPMNRTRAPLVAAAEISATASLPRSWRRPLMTTLVPPEASFKATALPMPEAAPVMSATRADRPCGRRTSIGWRETRSTCSTRASSRHSREYALANHAGRTKDDGIHIRMLV